MRPFGPVPPGRVGAGSLVTRNNAALCGSNVAGGTVSVYSEMLRMALGEDDRADRPVAAMPLPELVGHLLACRSRLSAGGHAADRLARMLTYDVALVRLCDRVGVEHDLTGDLADPDGRRQVEERLAGKVPRLAAGARSGRGS